MEEDTPRLWPWCVLCLLAALLVSLGDIHKHHNSDSLLPILESLYRWEPYFWIQNRVGMLVPLLAIPMKSPLANLLFQTTLNLFLGLLAVFLLARYLLRDQTYPLAGVVSIALFLGFCPTHTVWYIFLDCLCGVWLALGLGGLVLLQTEGCISWRRPLLAFALLVLAHWVYLSAFVLLAPLVIWRFLLCGSSRHEIGCRIREFWHLLRSGRKLRSCFGSVLNNRGTISLALLVAALALGYALSFVSPKPYRSLKLGSIPASQWPESGQRLIQSCWINVTPHTWYFLLLAVAALGILVSVIAASRVHPLRAWRSAAAAIAAGLVYVAFMGTRAHVYRVGNCDYHYCLAAIFFIQAGLVIAGIGPLAGNLPAPILRRLGYFGIPVVLAVAVYTYGMPSVRAVRASLERVGSLGRKPEDVLNARATHIMGDYWSVWATVFQCNVARYERGEPPIWGITYRCEPTRKYWSGGSPEQMRVAVPLGEEEEAMRWGRAFGLPEMQPIERWESVTIWRPKVRGNAGNAKHSKEGLASLPKLAIPVAP